MARNRGFTLLEVGVVIAIVSILAVVATASVRSARRNASVGATAFEVVLRLQGLRAKALAEQESLVAVLVNAPGGVSTACGALSPAKCLRWYVLRDPDADWALAGFDPADPGEKASLEESESLPAGIAIDEAATGTAAAAPFGGVKQLATQVTATCSGRKCLAVRFDPTGEVRPEYAGSDRPVLPGIAFGLTSELAGAGVERHAVLVSFPTGIVKSFPY